MIISKLENWFWMVLSLDSLKMWIPWCRSYHCVVHVHSYKIQICQIRYLWAKLETSIHLYLLCVSEKILLIRVEQMGNCRHLKLAS